MVFHLLLASMLSRDARGETIFGTKRRAHRFSTPMMDLLVQAASSNKLNPSGYSLVVLDSNQHVIHFKANQTVGQIGMLFFGRVFRRQIRGTEESEQEEKSGATSSHPMVFFVLLSVKNCQLPQINGNSIYCF